MMYALLEGAPVTLARSNVPSINPSTSIGALLRVTIKRRFGHRSALE